MKTALRSIAWRKKRHCPENALITASVALTIVAYYLLIFTEWGNYYHGGGPLDKAILDAISVLAVSLCFELFRSVKKGVSRGLLVFLGLPLLAISVFSLLHALKFIISAQFVT